MRKIIIYVILGISVALIGLLLIPAAILVVSIILIWSITDKLIRLLEK